MQLGARAKMRKSGWRNASKWINKCSYLQTRWINRRSSQNPWCSFSRANRAVLLTSPPASELTASSRRNLRSWSTKRMNFKPLITTWPTKTVKCKIEFKAKKTKYELLRSLRRWLITAWACSASTVLRTCSKTSSKTIWGNALRNRTATEQALSFPRTTSSSLLSSKVQCRWEALQQGHLEFRLSNRWASAWSLLSTCSTSTSTTTPNTSTLAGKTTWSPSLRPTRAQEFVRNTPRTISQATPKFRRREKSTPISRPTSESATSEWLEHLA